MFNSFRSQVRLTQVVLVFPVVMVGWDLLADLVNRRWVSAVDGVVLVLAAFACGLLSRMFGHQLRYSDVAQSLRQLARDLPAGVFRVYEHEASDTALVCSPVQGRRNFDLFVTTSLRDLDEATDPRAEGHQFVASTEYKVMRTAPFVWRFPAVDEVTRSAAAAPAPGGLQRWVGAMKMLVLNARTGVMNPDRAELERLLQIVRTADHVRDMPLPSVAGAADVG